MYIYIFMHIYIYIYGWTRNGRQCVDQPEGQGTYFALSKADAGIG